MRVKATYKYLSDCYPNLFPTTDHILYHLFFVGGNGYDWSNGQLSDKDKLKSRAEIRIDQQIRRDRLIAEAIEAGRYNVTIETFNRPRKLANSIYPLHSGVAIAKIPDNIQNDWLIEVEAAIELAWKLQRKTTDDWILYEAIDRIKKIKLHKLIKII